MTNPDQIYTSYIKTTPEKLWAAITNPEFTKQYWGGHVNVSDWKKGAKWEHQDTNNTFVRIAGEVLEYTPYTRLVLTWASPNDTKDVSTVTFQLEEIKGVVRLDVTHGNFNADSTMAGNVSKGWPLVLASLKTFLETGKPL